MGSAPRSDHLAEVAQLLGRAALDREVDAAVGVHLLDDGVELHLLPTAAGAHPLDALLGFDAPAAWAAVGTVTTGRAWDLDRGPCSAERVVLVHLAARDGHSTSLVGPPAGPLRSLDGPAQGCVADVCRRTLGLPTDAPGVSPLSWWAARWVDAMCAAPALELAQEADVVACFPDSLPPGTAPTLGALGDHGRALERSRPWSALREEAATGQRPAPGLTAADAAWLDDGSFARWVLRHGGELHAGLAEVELRLPPRLGRGVRQVLRRWAIPC